MGPLQTCSCSSTGTRWLGPRRRWRWRRVGPRMGLRWRLLTLIEQSPCTGTCTLARGVQTRRENGKRPAAAPGTGTGANLAKPTGCGTRRIASRARPAPDLVHIKAPTPTKPVPSPGSSQAQQVGRCSQGRACIAARLPSLPCFPPPHTS